MTDNKDAIKENMLATSRQWVERFNQGDVDHCVAAYKANAIMRAKPFGEFSGTDQIREFWAPFMASGAGELEYSDVDVVVVNEKTVVLSANWKMNVGRGIITKEKWVKQNDGSWLLEEDDFEVQEQY